ncbi:MAG: hypothetical protein JWM99_4262 [Verrucomicrobiales bacterium]|nr:hypothetical protein [Verrucomicrobiales bacterium]
MMQSVLIDTNIVSAHFRGDLIIESLLFSLQHDLVLVSRDHHFDHLQNLKKTVW